MTDATPLPAPQEAPRDWEALEADARRSSHAPAPPSRLGLFWFIAFSLSLFAASLFWLVGIRWAGGGAWTVGMWAAVALAAGAAIAMRRHCTFGAIACYWFSTIAALALVWLVGFFVIDSHEIDMFGVFIVPACIGFLSLPFVLAFGIVRVRKHRLDVLFGLSVLLGTGAGIYITFPDFSSWGLHARIAVLGDTYETQARTALGKRQTQTPSYHASDGRPEVIAPRDSRHRGIVAWKEQKNILDTHALVYAPDGLIAHAHPHDSSAQTFWYTRDTCSHIAGPWYWCRYY
ncbi:MAG: hypothetical protein WBD02_00710 [Acidimicrobiia bacterium]